MLSPGDSLLAVTPSTCCLSISLYTGLAFHSTQTAVLSVHNDLVRAVDNGQVSLLVLLDLSAGFDTVDHQILLSVLSDRFSVNSTTMNWFESYLTDRTQLFTHHGRQTSSFPVNCSVAQGSVFGPVVFISYTEDVVDLMDRHGVRSHMYADNTHFWPTVRSGLCHRKSVRPSVCLSVTLVYCGQTA